MNMSVKLLLLLTAVLLGGGMGALDAMKSKNTVHTIELNGGKSDEKFQVSGDCCRYAGIAFKMSSKSPLSEPSDEAKKAVWERNKKPLEIIIQGYERFVGVMKTCFVQKDWLERLAALQAIDKDIQEAYLQLDDGQLAERVLASFTCGSAGFYGKDNNQFNTYHSECLTRVVWDRHQQRWLPSFEAADQSLYMYLEGYDRYQSKYFGGLVRNVALSETTELLRDVGGALAWPFVASFNAISEKVRHRTMPDTLPMDIVKQLLLESIANGVRIQQLAAVCRKMAEWVTYRNILPRLDDHGIARVLGGIDPEFARHWVEHGGDPVHFDRPISGQNVFVALQVGLTPFGKMKLTERSRVIVTLLADQPDYLKYIDQCLLPIMSSKKSCKGIRTGFFDRHPEVIPTLKDHVAFFKHMRPLLASGRLSDDPIAWIDLNGTVQAYVSRFKSQLADVTNYPKRRNNRETWLAYMDRAIGVLEQRAAMTETESASSATAEGTTTTKSASSASSTTAVAKTKAKPRGSKSSLLGGEIPASYDENEQPEPEDE